MAPSTPPPHTHTHNNNRIARLLLAHGADLGTETVHWETAFHVAARCRNHRVARVLVAAANEPAKIEHCINR